MNDGGKCNYCPQDKLLECVISVKYPNASAVNLVVSASVNVGLHYKIRVGRVGLESIHQVQNMIFLS